jgi:hypothetical protein
MIMSNSAAFRKQPGNGAPISAFITQQYLALEKYVKHRETCFNHVNPKRMEIMTAISTLKRALDFYRYSPQDDFCRIVLKYEREMRLLIPGTNSRYYAGSKKAVDGLVDFSRAYLNIQ